MTFYGIQNYVMKSVMIYDMQENAVKYYIRHTKHAINILKTTFYGMQNYAMESMMSYGMTKIS